MSTREWLRGSQGGASSIVNGFDKWNHTSCHANQESDGVQPFPIFGSTLGLAEIRVVRETRLSPEFLGPPVRPAESTCASINLSMSGSSDDALIHLDTPIEDDDGSRFECNWDSPQRVALLVAHEPGHDLGLRESACSGSIMGGWTVQWNANSGTATYLAAGHAIRQPECQKADEVSISPSEADYEEQHGKAALELDGRPRIVRTTDVYFVDVTPD